jgi:hypothetical protein
MTMILNINVTYQMISVPETKCVRTEEMTMLQYTVFDPGTSYHSTLFTILLLVTNVYI